MLINTTDTPSSSISKKYGPVEDCKISSTADIAKMLSLKPQGVICDTKNTKLIFFLTDKNIQLYNSRLQKINHKIPFIDLWDPAKTREIMKQSKSAMLEHEFTGCFNEEYEKRGAGEIIRLLKNYYGLDIAESMHMAALEVFKARGHKKKVSVKEYKGIEKFSCNRYILDKEDYRILINKEGKYVGDNAVLDTPDFDLERFREKFSRDHEKEGYKSGPYYFMTIYARKIQPQGILSSTITGNLEELKEVLDRIIACPGFYQAGIIDKYGLETALIDSDRLIAETKEEREKIAIRYIDTQMNRVFNECIRDLADGTFDTRDVKKNIAKTRQCELIAKGYGIYLEDIAEDEPFKYLSDNDSYNLMELITSVKNTIRDMLLENHSLDDILSAYAFHVGILPPKMPRDRDYYEALLVMEAHQNKELCKEWNEDPEMSEENYIKAKKIVKDYRLGSYKRSID